MCLLTEHRVFLRREPLVSPDQEVLLERKVLSVPLDSVESVVPLVRPELL